MNTNLIIGYEQVFAPTIDDVAGQIAAGSRRVYTNDVRHFIRWLLEQGITPASMTRSDMIAYRAYLDSATYTLTAKDGRVIKPPQLYSKSAKQRMFAVACRLMREYHASGRGLVDVTSQVKGFKAGDDETTHTALSKQQAADMLAAIDTRTIQGKRDYALLLLLSKTGLRRSEVVALNRGNITMRDGHHVAIVEHGKGDKTRVVKIRVDVYRALRTYLESLPAAPAQAPLFISIRRGDHPTEQRLTDKAVEQLVKKHAPKDTDLSPHGLRATFATIALEEGASLHQVQYALGHRDPRTTERYQKRKLNLDHNAVDYLNF